MSDDARPDVLRTAVTLPTLTGLRALALLLIIVGWVAAAGGLPPEFIALDQVGLMIGVVLSGFLLAWHHAHDPFDRVHVSGYARGRAWRVLPGYLAILIAAIAIVRWWQEWPYELTSVADFARAVLLLEAPGPLWIIPVIAQCYLLFAVVWWLWSRGAHWAWIVAMGAVSSVPAFFGWGTGDQATFSVVAPYFLAGAGIGLAWTHGLGRWMSDRAGAVAIAGAIAFVLVVMNLPSVRSARNWNFSDSVVGATWLDPLTAIIVIVLVGAAAAQPASLQVLLAKTLQFLGRHAYALYLVLPVAIAALS